MLFIHISSNGEEKLINEHVLIEEMGARGTHLAEGLARAGVGELTIVDRDYIEYSHLHRQTMFTEMDAQERLPNVIAAERNLMAIRQELKLNPYIEHVDRLFLETYA